MQIRVKSPFINFKDKFVYIREHLVVHKKKSNMYVFFQLKIVKVKTGTLL